MCPSRWFTPTSGSRCTYASDLATEQPTSSEPTSPGPCVTAMPSRSGSRTLASASAFSTTGTITSRWRRDASSGTTPPYGAWIASCEATTLDRMRRPSASTAAAVSSHELSIPSTIIVRSSYSHSLQRETHAGRADSKGDAAESRAPGLASPLMRASSLLRPDLGLRALSRTLLLDNPHRLDHVERPLHLNVLLELLHRIEGGLLPVFRRGRVLGDLDDDVGGDALAVDRATLRREVLRRREPEPRAVGQRDDRLHRALAEGLRADDNRAAPVLQRPRDDLGGRRAALVDEHHHWQGRIRLLRVGREAHVLVPHAAFGVDDQLAVLDELFGDLDGRRQEAARIVAQIEEQRLHAVLRGLVERRRHVTGRLLLELPELHVGDAAAEIGRAHRLHPDLLARDVEILRLGPALPHDGDRHLRAGLAAHALDRVGQLHVLRDETVDLHDAVARLQAGPVGGRALDRGHDGEDIVAQRDLDAETAEASAGLDLHLLVAVRIEERAVRIEAAQGALDRVVDEVLRRDLVDVLVLHDGEDLGEELQLLVGLALIRALAGDGSAERQGEHHQECADHEGLLHGRPLIPTWLATLTEPLFRILRLALVTHLEVEPRPGERSRIAHRADSLSLPHVLALLRLDVGDVGVERVVLVAVVHDDQVTVPLEPSRIDDVTAVHRQHFPADRRLDVDSVPESPGAESRMYLRAEPCDDPPLRRPWQTPLQRAETDAGRLDPTLGWRDPR